MASRSDVWASADAYERYVGRWSRVVAAAFLDWLAVAPAASWLDVGCGTGALAQTLLARRSPRRLVGVDASPPYVGHARAQVHHAVGAFAAGDARQLPFRDRTFDAAVSGLVLNFVPDPALAAREIRRVVRPRGTVAAYVWDYAGDMQLMRRFWDAAVALDPAAAALDEGRRFPVALPEPLGRLFTDAGVVDVETRAIDVPTVFSDFDDYWTPFLGGQGPAPGYCVALPEESRTALRERLRATVPVRADGSIALVARAWAVKGIVPSPHATNRSTGGRG
jgi:SAM-dependent methyltransferase